MIEIQPGFGRGKWRKVGALIYVQCPQCNYCAALQHEIAPDGTVTPSVECPSGCGFHTNVRLTGWVPELENSARP